MGRRRREPPISRRSATCRRRCAPAHGQATVACARAATSSRSSRLRRARLGVAIDVGSTTIAAYLCDLATGAVVASVGAMNPQIRFGEDLMSRVSYVMMNPGGDAELTASVREAMNALIGEAAADAGVARGEIVEVDAGRQSDHASPRARPRSDRARRRALRTDDRRRLRGAGPRSRPRRRARRLRLCAALHRRPRRRRHRRRRAGRGALSRRRGEAHGRRRHQRRDRVRQPRAPARLLLADRPGVRGRPDFLRPARGAGRDRARPHRSDDARAALQGDRLRTSGRTILDSRKRRRTTASPACAAQGSSRRSPRWFSPASSPRTA